MEPIKTYTRNEVCDLLKCSLSTVGMLVKTKQIYSVRVGRAIRIPDWAVRDYVEGRPAQFPADPMQEDDGDVNRTDSLFSDGTK